MARRDSGERVHEWRSMSEELGGAESRMFSPGA